MGLSGVVAVALLLIGLGHVVQAVTDPLKKSNRDATEADFWQWVSAMEANHQTYTPTVNPEMTTEATSSSTLYVGNGGYSKVQDAVDAAPSGGGRTTIQIASGSYWSATSIELISVKSSIVSSPRMYHLMHKQQNAIII